LNLPPDDLCAEDTFKENALFSLVVIIETGSGTYYTPVTYPCPSTVSINNPLANGIL